MKILLAIHDFLPKHNAGSEIYTYTLARELIRRGHEILLVFTESRPKHKQYRVTAGVFDGIPFREIVYNSAYRLFEETYVDKKIDSLFEGFLDEFEPDIVHLQHLQYLSLGVIRLARDRSVPVVFTLHEYCLTCPRKGLRMTESLELCHDLDSQKCARCIQKEPVRLPPLVTFMDRWNAFAHGWIPQRARRFVWKRLVWLHLISRDSVAAAEPPEEDLEDKLADCAEAIETRWRVVREHLAKVDLFIAPSPFLRRKFIEFGVAENQIVFSDYGFDASSFRDLKRTKSDVVRFGFIGTIVEHKGVLTAVRAMSLVDDPRAILSLFGDTTFFPDYFSQLEKAARPERIRFEGRFDNREVAKILASLDVLIVPSLWFENSPLTIHEAFLAGIPVVTTDLGGMKDLVEDGVSGLLFERGNHEDLASKIRAFLDDPGLRDRLAAGIPKVKSIVDDAEWMEQRYSALREGVGEG